MSDILLFSLLILLVVPAIFLLWVVAMAVFVEIAYEIKKLLRWRKYQ